MRNKGKGIFVVIEGTDGSGKATQTKFLAEKLQSLGIPFELADFPQYGKPSSHFAEKYLRGEYGTAEEVGPYRGSLFYAIDRYEKSFDIKRWLAEGKVVISNRYVSANMGHQAGKIKNKVKREKFLKWLLELEYDIFGIPKPDATILLYVPPEVGQKFVDQKGERAYTKGKKRDIHEADLKHLQDATKAYLSVAKKYKWTVIEYRTKKGILSLSEVRDRIWENVVKLVE
ncbi:MAG: deoxynucleoside kinase [Candidatus Taylorbacteria bacterium]|nr:deoxynucleoside kinase [Candidatus Taylorbacteria bacterium]